MPSRLTPSLFIEKAKKVHGDLYDYSKITYVHSAEKVTIICKKHGPFVQRPQKHLNGQGCPHCRFEKSASKQRLTTSEFIERAINIHGNKYDYSKVQYVNNHTKIIIICPSHGEFLMLPSNHTHGSIPQGCPECGGKRRWSSELFISDARKIHRDKYSYYKTRFVSLNSPVIIICREHGEFIQKPTKHLSGQGCPICAGTKKKTTEEFVNKAKSIHGDKYCYDDVKYTTTHSKVKIICPEHGVFEMTPANHTHKNHPQGCPKCSGRKVFNTEDFIKYANEIHDGLYNYEKVEYVDSITRVRIICPYHGDFLQKPFVHLLGSGCSKCRSPKGENKIESILKNMKVPYENQFSFPDCRYKNPLFFDFKIVVNNNIGLIEFNGQQHYEIINTNIFNFDEIILRDNVKRKYCEKNSIKLLEIRYDQYDNIERLLVDFINKMEEI